MNAHTRPTSRNTGAHAASPSRRWGWLWRATIWTVMGFFLLNVVFMIATVVVNSVATRWFGTPLPEGFTLSWYGRAWDDFQLAHILVVTLEVVAATVLLSILLGVPAAYALARARFPGKRLAMLLILLPMMVPPVSTCSTLRRTRGLKARVSIARRLQDPLAELVKIDPKSIGVGQYQHDVNQSQLARSLDAVVEDCVNGVGVDLNTASAPLLSRVSGLSTAVANSIVRWRDANGAGLLMGAGRGLARWHANQARMLPWPETLAPDNHIALL